MKMIILCAGKGSRINIDIPKCMLKINEKPILFYQLKMAKQFYLTPVVVKGFKPDEVLYHRSYINENFSSTNMIASFMTAREEFTEDVIVSYGDILYNGRILDSLKRRIEDFVVVGDIHWKYYWKLRYDSITEDTESFSISQDSIIDIGRPVKDSNNIDARYVGLLKFSKKGLDIISKIYDSDKKWEKAYFTDILQELIDREYKVKIHKIENGWVEFDTDKDYKTWSEVEQLRKVGISL